MEENKEILELLRKIERTNRIKMITGIVLCVLMLAAAVSCVGICVMVIRLMPGISGILEQMQTVLSDLEQTSVALAELDFAAMVTDVDALVVYAQESLVTTMEKLETIDLETLNQAIRDLAEIIEPLANFVRRFG